MCLDYLCQKVCFEVWLRYETLRSMKFLILIFSFVFLSQSAFAKASKKFDPSSLWANHFANRLVKIKKPKDMLLYLNLTSAHFDQIDKAIKQNKISVPQVTYKVYLSQIFMIDKNKNRIVIDFSKFKNKKLVLNKKTIRLASDKSYSDYVFEVSKALGSSKNSSLDLFFNSAYAQNDINPGNFLTNQAAAIAAIFTSASSPEYLNGFESEATIETSLLRAYRNEADQARRVRSRGQAVNLTSYNFLCENNRLSKVVEFAVVTDGKLRTPRSEAKYLIKEATGGYTYKYGQPGVAESSSCLAQISDAGVVTKLDITGFAVAFCPELNLNVFNDPSYFGGFPKAASTCCQKEGCYETVQRNLTSIRKDLLGTKDYEVTDPVAPAEEQGTE